MGRFGIGNRIERLEDDRFLTGRGRFLDDMVFNNVTHAVFVRSPVAHAELGAIATTAALAAPGVYAVLTADDLAADGVTGLPTEAGHWVELFKPDGSPSYCPDRPLLAAGRVRYAGEAVAMVIAESEEAALEAAERVDVAYTALGAVVDTGSAHEAGNPQLHDDAPDNTAFLYRAGDTEAVAAAFEKAAHVVTLGLVNNRVIVSPLEARGAVGEGEPL